MKGLKRESLTVTLLPVAVAIVLWFFAFAVEYGNFWVKISLSAACLAAYSFAIDFSYYRENLRITTGDIAWGLVSAAALYGVFFLGNLISNMLLPFATGQVSSIYGKGAGIPAWMIAAALAFITGPAEEIFWRGFLQRRLSGKLGRISGCILATAFYAGVHKFLR